jgi:hypothetical protein
MNGISTAFNKKSFADRQKLLAVRFFVLLAFVIFQADSAWSSSALARRAIWSINPLKIRPWMG